MNWLPIQTIFTYITLFAAISSRVSASPCLESGKRIWWTLSQQKAAPTPTIWFNPHLRRNCHHLSEFASEEGHTGTWESSLRVCWLCHHGYYPLGHHECIWHQRPPVRRLHVSRGRCHAVQWEAVPWWWNAALCFGCSVKTQDHASSVVGQIILGFCYYFTFYVANFVSCKNKTKKKELLKFVWNIVWINVRDRPLVYP